MAKGAAGGSTREDEIADAAWRFLLEPAGV